MVGEGVDELELEEVLRFAQTELVAAFCSAVLKFSCSATPYCKYKRSWNRAGWCVFREGYILSWKSTILPLQCVFRSPRGSWSRRHHSTGTLCTETLSESEDAAQTNRHCRDQWSVLWHLIFLHSLTTSIYRSLISQNLVFVCKDSEPKVWLFSGDCCTEKPKEIILDFSKLWKLIKKIVHREIGV